MSIESQTPGVDAAKWRVDRGYLAGIALIGATVLFVTAWMATQGRAALAAPSRPVATNVQTVDDARFRDNALHLPNDSLLGFVEIPAGTFTIGSDPTLDRAAYDNERWSESQRQGRIELGSFYIGRYEVTVGQFAAFVEATHRAVDSQTLRAQANHPVTYVTWTDALAYAQWLDRQLKASDQVPSELASLFAEGWQIALPNEAQWEKAARGTDGRIYPWGNEPNDSYANFNRGGISAVGSFACPQCAFGLADLSGNVWELTRSPFQAYPWKPSDESIDPSADALFVMRGGAYNDAANNVRTAIRGGIDPGARRAFIGFRLVLEKREGA
jgi:formylglycine-generating enzyme required for sulfatase activity